MWFLFRIIGCVNTVFYGHLCNWVIYGDLVDVYNEFFICDGHCPDENFLYPEQIVDDSNSNLHAVNTFVSR